MTKKKLKEVTVKRNADNPEPTEIIANSIVEISQAMKKIKAGRLNENAIVILIKQSCPSGSISQMQIKAVLSSLEELENIYLKAE